MHHNHLPLIAAGMLSVGVASADAGIVASFPFDVSNGFITETVSGQRYAVGGQFGPESAEGVTGQALRLDGYTTVTDARIGDILKDSPAMTVSVWCALEAWPIVGIDMQTEQRVPVVDCIDEEARTGFAFNVGIHGKWSFTFYAGGWPLTLESDKVLPIGKWNNLTAVVDPSDRMARLYLDGEKVAESRCNGTVTVTDADLYIGYSRTENKSGMFRLTSWAGLIDDLKISDEAASDAEIARCRIDARPDFSIPASRFADDLLRPRFHGMPGAGWTNETHGMTYSDGRYHVFFQKNPNGPYMARLHWGHISSGNLYDWREEPIAFGPDTGYDIKGCWSGAVFSDDVITGGRPAAIYTAVDYARAVIAMAVPDDDTLTDWSKSSRNPIINGRPSGLSDDFRDPYFFRDGDNAYIIVGSSKGGVGTATLHRYNPVSGTWSNDGSTFFTGTDAATCGVFWEMPTVTRMGDKWLFTATPLQTSRGVRTLYWTGDIAPDGTFMPDAASASPRRIELISEDGYGLLSPTIYQHEGKTLVMGIVPDKLPSADNWRLGWAHTYSLPREWGIDNAGNITQRPYSGLAELRSSGRSGHLSDYLLQGSHDFAEVRGRAVEVKATFEVGDSAFGVTLFGDGNGEGVISFNPATCELTADFTGVRRLVNDSHLYNGVYRCVLPEWVAKGSDLTLDIYADHSIVDIFVNDRWATSIRVFPTEPEAVRTGLWSAGTSKVKDASAWCLESDGSGVDAVTGDNSGMPGKVVTLDGIVIGDTEAVDTSSLPAGVYVIDGRLEHIGR